MKLQFARRPDKKWAVFDEGEQVLRLDGASTEEVTDWFIQQTRRLLKAWLLSPPPQMTYREMRVRAGLIRCIVCDAIVRLEDYRPELGEENQRCAEHYAVRSATKR